MSSRLPAPFGARLTVPFRAPGRTIAAALAGAALLLVVTASALLALAPANQGPFTGCLSRLGLIYNVAASPTAPLRACLPGDAAVTFGTGQGPVSGASTGGAVAQFRTVTSPVPGSWQACLYAYTDGYDICTDPAAAGYAGAADSILVPGNGAKVGSLQVSIGSSLSPAVSANVLDNGVPTSVTCTISAGTTCTYSGPEVVVAAGHYLQLKVTNLSNGEALDEFISASFRY